MVFGKKKDGSKKLVIQEHKKKNMAGTVTQKDGSTKKKKMTKR